MNYPFFLHPTQTEPFTVNDNIIEIPKCIVGFERWTGNTLKETFGGKAVVCVDNKPMFAELAIMTYFVKDGWQARWVETYGRGKRSRFVYMNGGMISI